MARMHKQISIWKAQHANFRRLLDLLDAEIRVFHAGSRPDYDLMGDAVYYLVHYADRFHHPKEDIALETLVRRASEFQPLAAALNDEHKAIANTGMVLVEQLQEVVAGALMPRVAVEGPAATYSAYYRQHMAREEAEFFPRLERLLNEEDWAAVEKALPIPRDPLFAAEPQERYADLYRHIVHSVGSSTAGSDGTFAEGTSWRMPEFFSRVPSVAMRDALAQFLGAAEGGRIEYSYGDVVKLTGHSCPTVAGAYAATLEALARLYPGELPERGAIAVELRGHADEGVTGVVASVAGLITGAAAEGGFKGIAGRFERRGLMRFGASIAADLRFTRIDTGASVEIELPRARAMSADLMAALRRALSPDASEDERERFAANWQARTAAILLPSQASARDV